MLRLTLFFLSMNLLLSCGNNRQIEPIVQDGMKNLPDLNNDSITTDSLVSRIKSKLIRTPMYPPNHSFRVLESDKENYTETNYGEHYNPFAVFSDNGGNIKLIRTSYSSHSHNYHAYYYFDNDKLIYLYYFDNSYFLPWYKDKDGNISPRYNGNDYYFDNDKLIYWISQDTESEEQILNQDSENTIVPDLSDPENILVGDHLLQNAYNYLNEAKSRIGSK